MLSEQNDVSKPLWFFFWDSIGGYYDLYRLNLTAEETKETFFFSVNDKFHSTCTFFYNLYQKGFFEAKKLPTHQKSAVVDLVICFSQFFFCNIHPDNIAKQIEFKVDLMRIENLETIISYCRKNSGPTDKWPLHYPLV